MIDYKVEIDDLMKCAKCKFKNGKTGSCLYPFKAFAAGDHKLDKNGNIIGMHTWNKEITKYLYCTLIDTGNIW